MTDLSPIAKDALAALRARHALEPGVKSRLRARIERSIAAGDAASIEAADVESLTVARLDVRALAIRVALPVAIAAAVLLSLWAIAPRHDAARAERDAEGQAVYDAEPRRDATAESASSRRSTSSDDARTVSGDQAAAPEVEPVEHVSPMRRASPRAAGDRDAGHAVPPSEPPASDTTLAAEMRLLRRARTAMREADPARALGALEAHAEAFAHGQMAEDRDALRVEALCAADRRDDARSAADAFARAWPGSPHEARVQKMCAGP